MGAMGCNKPQTSKMGKSHGNILKNKMAFSLGSVLGNLKKKMAPERLWFITVKMIDPRWTPVGLSTC